MKKLFFFFFQILNFIIINCYIKIPLKLFPCQISDKLNISNTFNNMVMKQLYAKIEIGSPKQTIFIPLELEKNDFYISKYNSHISNKKYDSFHLKNFNEESSSSFHYLSEEKNKAFYNKNFDFASKAKDLFFFGNKKTELEFYLAGNLSEEIPGEIGLQIHTINDLNTALDSDDKSFLKKIKDNGIIDNYIWSIIYNNDDSNDIDAYLYIGDFLHNIKNDLSLKNIKFKEDSLSSINAYVYQKKVTTEFEMSKLYLYKADNPNNIIKEVNLSKMYLSVKLDYNLCGIKASEIIHSYLAENVFTEKNKCHKDYFDYNNKYIFYYCDKNPSSLKNIKNNFPILNFLHQEFNFNFTITLDDLLVEKENYYYFLIFFGYSNNRYDWKLGKPFLDKYNFMVDQDGKKILFYSEKQKDVIIPGVQNISVSGQNKKSLILLVILLIIIVLILCAFLGKNIHKTKIRKHKNIFDNNLEYSLSSGIEMTKK